MYQMTAQEFVDTLKVVVSKAAAKGVLDTLQKPPGRSPKPELVKLSHWFQNISPEDRESVSRVAELATDQALYNFLLVLDGLLRFDPSESDGRLELFYDNAETRTQLNGEEAEELTALF